MNGPIHTAATKEIIDALWFDVKSGAVDDEETLEQRVIDECNEFCLCIGELIAIDDAAEEMLAYINKENT